METWAGERFPSSFPNEYRGFVKMLHVDAGCIRGRCHRAAWEKGLTNMKTNETLASNLAHLPWALKAKALAILVLA